MGCNMLINLRNLKLKVNKTEHFKLEKTLSNKLLDTVDGKFIEPCQVEMIVERTGNLYLATGKLKTKIEIPCSRCLSKTFYAIKTDVVFSIVESVHEDEFSEEDKDIVFYNETEVNITPVIVETILVNLPIQALCQAECQGLCAKCGVNKNLASCNCKVDNIDPRWAKLKDLL